jgi:hypothetical protein
MTGWPIIVLAMTVSLATSCDHPATYQQFWMNMGISCPKAIAAGEVWAQSMLDDKVYKHS